MTKIKPDFMKSPYFVDEPGNWHLKPGAPAKLQTEFNDYMASLKVLDDDAGTINGISIDYPYDR